MQHSPTEVKKRLDQAVDPDGNVMDLVAVLEIVSILEKLPLTKEALEKTRIGRTINLLRKKTENAELAKRAKKLVKKWQTLVASHLEALRVGDSPLNGQRSSSSQVNGIIANEGERPNSAGSEKLDKCKLLERKRKRKREKESSSSESSPVIFSKNLDEIKKRGESDRKSVSPLPKSKKLAIGTLLTKGSVCCVENTASKDGIINNIGKNINLTNSQLSRNETLDGQDLKKENNVTNLKELPFTENSKSKNLTFLSNVENSKLERKEAVGEKPSIAKEFAENTPVTEIMGNDTGNGIHVEPIPNNDGAHQLQMSTETSELEDTSSSNSNVVIENDLFLDSQDSFSCSQEDMSSLDESLQTKTPFIPSESMLDMSVEATGITGRYGSDGKWYSWTDVMPFSDGDLNILPYVILD